MRCGCPPLAVDMNTNRRSRLYFNLARTAMCLSCLRRPQPALICKAHGLETCSLNHAPSAVSTPLLATSFYMEAGIRRLRRRRPPCIPRPAATSAGSRPLRPAPVHPTCGAAGRGSRRASSRSGRGAYVRRGGLTHTFDQCLRSAEY
jgi:hypothetical protein